MYAEILVDIPDSGVNRRYTYAVPENLQTTLEVGRRVLIPFGHRVCEGYVVATSDHSPVAHPRAVLRVLDRETVLTAELLHLAEWMAGHYLCPVSTVLKTMLPKPLKRRRQRVVVPLLGEEEGQELLKSLGPHPGLAGFMERLWDEGEMGLSQARRLLGGDEAIYELEEVGLLAVSGTYQPLSYTLASQVYVVSDEPAARELWEVLSRRAPRQAEALGILLEEGAVPAAQLEKRVPKGSLNILLKKGLVTKKVIYTGPEKVEVLPTAYQMKAIEGIDNMLRSGQAGKCLLFGVTGSGKTEVYLQVIDRVTRRGKQVIVLVPEIALTQQMIEVFAARVGDRLAVLHSRLSDYERYEEWKRISTGKVDVVLGPRSAVFAPFANLGLIIIDEEQEHTYKQEVTPRYHAREVAEKRAELQGAVVVLGTATPSIETFYRATRKKEYQLIELPLRVSRHSMPPIHVVDLREEFKAGNRSIFSGVLKDKLEGCLARGEQAILFLNRRGYFTFLMCRECGLVINCPHCSIPLTYHQSTRRLHCHYCFFTAEDQQTCPRCQGKYLRRMGLGTQRVEEEVRKLFPTARVRRMDIDTTRKKGAHHEIITGMQRQEIDILVGTQMVAKGFDFPRVSLVGVINADTVLNLPDFRAYERGFQLLLQVAGRAGRASIPGEVVIQTYEPDSYAVSCACNHSYRDFYRREIEFRESMGYPPFTNLVRVVVSSPGEREAMMASREIRHLLEELLPGSEDDAEVLGPGPCPLARIRDRYRYQLLLRGSNLELLTSAGRYIIDKRKSKNVRIDIDINPLIMM